MKTRIVTSVASAMPAAALLIGLALAAPTRGQPAAVPPPILQLKTDCNRPQYASDRLVCTDRALLAADAELAGMPQPAPAADAIWEDQDSWMRRRSLCAFREDHRACLAAAYADRKRVLAAAGSPRPDRRLRCDGPWFDRALTAGAFSEGEAVAIGGERGLMAVASPRPVPEAQWQPLLTWQAAGETMRLEAENGVRMTCWSSGR